MSTRKVCPRSSAPVLAIVLVVGLALPLTARAEEAAAAAPAAPDSPARQLFAEGRKLAAEGKYEAACPKFEESFRLEVGVGTQFNLADCWERIGRTAGAHALFLGAAASAKAVGQADREQVLRERATALEPRLSRLVVEVAATAPKLTVKRDKLPLDSETWGKAVAIDPGHYTITARAPGKQPWEKRVEVTRATPLTTVEIPELEPIETEKSVPPPTPTVKKSLPVEPYREPMAAERGQGPNYGALTVAGLGVGALAVGAVMGLNYKSANDDAKAICPTSRECRITEIQDHDRLLDEAKTARSWSYAGFAVGTFSLLGAGVLWYFQRPKTTSTATWRATPELSADGSLGAKLSGSF